MRENKIKKKIAKFSNSWILYSLVAMLCTTGIYLIYKFTSNKIHPDLLLFYIFLIDIILLTFLVLKEKFSLRVSFWQFVILFIASIVAVMTNIISVVSIRIAPNPGYFSAISSASIVIVTILSFVIFKSEINIRKFLGIMLTVIGLVILSTG